MSSPALYACPSCNSIVSTKEADSDDLTCEKCGHEFNPHAQDKAELPNAPPPAKLPTKSGATVSRDVMKNRGSLSGFGTKTSPGIAPVNAKDPSQATATTEDSEDHDPGYRRRRKKKRKENNKAFYLFLLGWLLLFTCIILVVKNMDDTESNHTPQTSDQDKDPHTAARDRQFMEKHGRTAMAAVQRYMVNILTEERQPHIDHSIKLSRSFSQHYRTHNPETWEGPPRVLASNVLETPAGLSIEYVIGDDTNNIMEAHAIWDGSLWKLDWEQMARYSEEDWTFFMTQRGRQEADFRCFARLVETNDPEQVAIKVYRPWPHGAELNSEILQNYALPNIELHADDPVAKKFKKLWQDYLDGKGYESVLDDDDPKGYMRLHATLAWNLEDPDEPLLEMKDIKAPHWFGKRILDAEIEAAAGKEKPDQKS